MLERTSSHNCSCAPSESILFNKEPFHQGFSRKDGDYKLARVCGVCVCESIYDLLSVQIAFKQVSTNITSCNCTSSSTQMLPHYLSTGLFSLFKLNWEKRLNNEFQI